MFSRFFIDRPIFATVISVVITLAGGVAVFTLPVAQYPEVTPPTVQVTAIYPGANSITVRDTVAAPIEAQVSGVEGMMYMASQCTNDGSYSLTVTFKAGMNSDMAQVLVQNRVSLALPVIPQLVQNQGISVKKMSPATLMIVNLISPNNQWDALYLSNYATIYIKDELGRLPGVAGITYLGQRDYSLRAWLDPDKLAALNLSATDVINAIAEQNIQVAAGNIGQPPSTGSQQFQLPIETKGRLTDPEEFGDIIVKAGGSGTGGGAMPSAGSGQPSSLATGIVRLRDVVRENRYYSRIQFDPGRLHWYMLNELAPKYNPFPEALQEKLKPIVGKKFATENDLLQEVGKILSAEELEQYQALIVKQSDHEVKPARLATALASRHMKVIKDPDAKDVDGELLSWFIIFSGQQPPLPQDLATNTKLNLGKPDGRGVHTFKLGEFIDSVDKIERLPSRDELGVQLGSQQYDQTCTLDGRASVALSIFQLPGSNALDTAKGVYKKMKELRARFPEGMEYRIVYDTTPFISESVDEVFHTLRDAVILVAIVVLLFLQDWRAMILPMIDVPVSLIGTYAIMAAMGFTLNNLTLFGLVLAIGIVVDDAIVVLENIERLIATGLDSRSATIKAMEEITGPILAITLVLSSVFIPCCFLGGLTGQFFRQFAVTIAVSTIISAINAITMTPSRAVVIFKTEEGHGHDGGHGPKREALPWWIFGLLGLVTMSLLPHFFAGKFGLPPLVSDEEGGVAAIDIPVWQTYLANAVYFTPGMLLGLLLGWWIIGPVNRVLGAFFRAFNRGFDRMTEGYSRIVSGFLRISLIVCLLYGGLLVLTFFQFVRAPTGFIPQQDKGYLILNVQLPDASSVERTEQVMDQIEKLVLPRKKDGKYTGGLEGVAHTVGISGKSLILNANAPNFGSMYIMLKPFEERHGSDLSADAIAAKVKEVCQKNIKGADVSVFGGPPVDGLGTTGGFKLIIEDRGNLGMDELQRVSDDIVRRGKAKEIDGLVGLGNGSRSNTPWLYLDIDRTKCKALGINVSDIFNTLQIYIGSYYVNNFNEFGRTWQVNVQADQKFRAKVSDIGQLQVRNKSGQMVRLGTLLTVRENYEGPVMIMRYNMYSATAITGNTAAGTSSGQAIDMMQELADKKLPRTMAYDWTELTYLQLQAGNTAMYVFFLGVMFVFLVLAAQYESWSLPLAVILVVPMCLLCSVSVIVMNSMEVNIFTQIGFVVLVGLASKNAILIVEFAKVRSEAGEEPHSATVEASRLRLRPILMTSFAFILGVVPLVLSTGAGAEMRRSLGLAVFGGMLGVTAFGIFLTPVFYYVIRKYSGPATPPLHGDLPEELKHAVQH